MDNFTELMRRYNEIDFELTDLKQVASTYQNKLNLKKQQIANLEKESAGIQHSVAKYMIDNGLVEEVFGNVTVAPKKLPDLVFIKDENKIPPDYINEKTKITKTIDKKRILSDLKKGGKVAGANLVKDRYSIQFKNIKITE